MKPHAKDAKHAKEQVQIFRFIGLHEISILFRNPVATSRSLRPLREAFIR
jgi:hypothetical protein